MKRVEYTGSANGEVMRRMPSGDVSFSRDIMATLRDIRDKDRAGYEVMLDGEPLRVPRAGFLEWLHGLAAKLMKKDGADHD